MAAQQPAYSTVSVKDILNDIKNFFRELMQKTFALFRPSFIGLRALMRLGRLRMMGHCPARNGGHHW